MRVQAGTGQQARVWLDGREVSFVLMADEELGRVTRIQLDTDGAPLVRSDGSVVVRTDAGRVTIVEVGR